MDKLTRVLVATALCAATTSAFAGENACTRLGSSVAAMCKSAVKAEKVVNATFFQGDFCTESGSAVYAICEQQGADAVRQKFGGGCRGKAIITKNVTMLNCKQRLDGQDISGTRRDSIGKDCVKVAFHWDNLTKSNPSAQCE